VAPYGQTWDKHEAIWETDNCQLWRLLNFLTYVAVPINLR